MCLYIPPIYIMEDTVLLILHLPLPFPTHFMLDSLPPRGGPYISHYLESFVAWFQIWDNRRRWRVWGERSLALSFFCFGSIALVVAACLRTCSSCMQPILQNLALSVSSTPLAPRFYLRLGFLETDWGGEVHADGLLMNALGRHTCKKRRENEVSQKEMLTCNTDRWDPADSTGSSGAGMALQNFPNWEKGPGLLYLCVR